MDGIYEENILPCVRESPLYKYSSRIVERTGKMLVAGFQSEDDHQTHEDSDETRFDHLDKVV